MASDRQVAGPVPVRRKRGALALGPLWDRSQPLVITGATGPPICCPAAPSMASFALSGSIQPATLHGGGTVLPPSGYNDASSPKLTLPAPRQPIVHLDRAVGGDSIASRHRR